MSEKIAIIGMGNMGSAIKLQLEAQEGYEVIGIGHGDDLSQINAVDTVIIAVKPQSFDELAAELNTYMDNHLVLSVMAGVRTRRIADALGIKAEDVGRAMPTLGVKAHASKTGYWAASEGAGNIIGSIVNTWGWTTRLETEDEFDDFTADVGAGVGIVYWLGSIIEKSALAHGRSKEEARSIGVDVIRSAASVLSDDSSAGEMFGCVKSKRGVTEREEEVLIEHNVENILLTMFEAGAERSRELGKS